MMGWTQLTDKYSSLSALDSIRHRSLKERWLCLKGECLTLYLKSFSHTLKRGVKSKRGTCLVGKRDVQSCELSLKSGWHLPFYQRAVVEDRPPFCSDRLSSSHGFVSWKDQFCLTGTAVETSGSKKIVERYLVMRSFSKKPLRSSFLSVILIFGRFI